LQHFLYPTHPTDDGAKLVYIIIEEGVEPFWRSSGRRSWTIDPSGGTTIWLAKRGETHAKIKSIKMICAPGQHKDLPEKDVYLVQVEINDHVDPTAAYHSTRKSLASWLLIGLIIGSFLLTLWTSRWAGQFQFAETYYQDWYDHSQWADSAQPRIMGDAELYALSGWHEVRGEMPFR